MHLLSSQRVAIENLLDTNLCGTKRAQRQCGEGKHTTSEWCNKAVKHPFSR